MRWPELIKSQIRTDQEPLSSGRQHSMTRLVAKYLYDALNDLTTTTQQIGTVGTTQTRSFVYDPLKRLTSATNPESGAITYQYDNNGNLTSKTDPRSIATTINYDVLNRPTSKTYSDTTPAVN